MQLCLKQAGNRDKRDTCDLMGTSHLNLGGDRHTPSFRRFGKTDEIRTRLIHGEPVITDSTAFPVLHHLAAGIAVQLYDHAFRNPFEQLKNTLIKFLRFRKIQPGYKFRVRSGSIHSPAHRAPCAVKNLLPWKTGASGALRGICAGAGGQPLSERDVQNPPEMLDRGKKIPKTLFQIRFRLRGTGTETGAAETFHAFEKRMIPIKRIVERKGNGFVHLEEDADSVTPVPH